jgi:hypothetical protein
MSEVFILGAGFSKAISPRMPLTRELTNVVFERFKQQNDISKEVRTMLEEDFEKALTYLANENPWLRESENLRNRALYLDLTHFIRAVIHEHSKGTDVWHSNTPPFWLEGLITHWHKNRCTVITLNYDTLIERVASGTYWASRSKPIPTGRLYPIDLTPAGLRSTGILSEEKIETFRLFKLHGSINWFYSGRSQFYGENLFFVPCRKGLDGTFDALMGSDPEREDWRRVGDKTALIIPPILDKQIYFQHESLRSMWVQASRAIREAEKIVCMGYSLPTGDLTMGQFLKSSAPNASVPFHLVNVSPMKEHFQTVIGNGLYEFRQENENLDCIPRFVVDHCVSDQRDREQILGATQWTQEK